MAKVALITGCYSGIGLALCYSLDKQTDKSGKKVWRVFASARDINSIRNLADDGLEVIQLDVTQKASVENAIAQVIAKANTIDLVICNAGKVSLLFVGS